MLQRALEKALDSDLDALSQRQLIEPLQLSNTGYVIVSSCDRPAAMIARAA